MVEKLSRLLQSKNSIISSLCQPAKPYLISKLIGGQIQNQLILYFCKNEKEAESLSKILKSWLAILNTKFPIYIYKDIEENNLDYNNPILLQGLIKKKQFLANLIQNKAGIYFVPIDFIENECPSLKNFESNFLNLTTEQNINTTEISKQLIDIGYEQEICSSIPGQFSKKGGLLEIFPINNNYPIHVELLGNKIDSIVQYDLCTKKTINKIPSTDIAPIKNNNNHGKLLNYISIIQNNLVVLDNPDELEKMLNLLSSKTWLSFKNSVKNSRQIAFSSFPQNNSLNLNWQNISNYSTNLLLLKNDLENKYKNWQIKIFTKDKNQIQKIIKNLKISNHNISLAQISDSLANISDLQGFQDSNNKNLFLTDQEIIKPIKKIKSNINQAFISKLKINDFIVHEDHGIGIFKGITKKPIDNIEKEFLILEYAEKDKLFLPIEYCEKITKYIGLAHPKIHRLHGAIWQETKNKIKQDAQKIAKELLQIYAKREQSQGFKFESDNEEQKELEKSFPYHETKDQLKVLEEVKNDMEKIENNKPMDRLICGDVGFGKTEIAMRAAFKAVQNKKQVAILCPTTILAQQHFDNFKQRLAKFSINIALMSRFQGPSAQEDITLKLALNEIDIVIGTHRLLSDDIKFNDLGLLILDEEQRFGVKHKEKIKSLKANIDILTLTATPIPRTLHLSLSKLRDVSIINTPPPGRLPVTNFIQPYSEKTIVSAIKKERKRNGQIYYLHNRVETIDVCAKKIKMLVQQYCSKKINIAIAHGQMSEKKLAETMHNFHNKKIDILVCSSIIENGLDLPNVNTIIIENSSKFGLADLYQLRGRVGRGNRQACAYFLYQSQELKENARKRLEALLEAKELGSGFQLALRDLEIRGAGNILGKEQSGAVTTVGLNLYCRLLHQACENLKSGKDKEIEQPDVVIDLPLSAYIPEQIIPDTQERLKIYQEIANIDNLEELNQYQKTFSEKYQDNHINNLFYLLETKILAKQANIKSIDTQIIRKIDNTKYTRLVITFQDKTDYKKAYNLVQINPNWDIEDKNIKISQSDLGLNWLDNLKQSIIIFI